ncbi:unnamed protein product, partial [Staurois parvus]
MQVPVLGCTFLTLSDREESTAENRQLSERGSAPIIRALMISALMIGAQQTPRNSAPTCAQQCPHLCPAVPPPVPLCSATYLCPAVPPTCAQPAPPTCAHQCHPPVPTHQCCPPVSPTSATHQCCQSVPPVSAPGLCPCQCASQCPEV